MLRGIGQSRLDVSRAAIARAKRQRTAVEVLSAERTALANGYLVAAGLRRGRPPEPTKRITERRQTLPAQSKFMFEVTRTVRLTGQIQTTPRSAPDYPVWDGIER